ncbi:MAG: glycosyltransferase [Bacteroidales bacterium]|nr:glycosyltransferase [Bacteroidales bacterium]
MKICFISKTFNNVGGIEKITCDLANSLSQKKFNANVLQLERKIHPYYSFNEEVKLSSLKCKENKKIYVLIKLFFFLNFHRINRLVIQNMNLGYISILRKFKLVRTKIIFVDHSSLNYYLSNNIQNEITKRIKYTKHADMVVALTSDNQRSYTEKLELPKSKVVCIPNFTNLVANGNYYSESSTTIIAIGRLDKQKRFDLLLDAFSIVNKINQNWNLEIYGEGKERSSLQEKIDKLNLSKVVFLKGNYNSINEAMNNKSFLVASSEFEGFGIMLLEGLAFGMPLVSFDCYSGPSEMIKNGFNGYLANKLDVKDLADKICNMIANKELRSKMSQNAKLVYQNFEKEYVVQKWIDMFSNF